MPIDQNPKQLIAQRIKDVTNILVTVSHDPSVDELSAALAMALMLDKMGKAATAVFSGKIPSAIEFLEPGKTFDANVDGLRDFIIALDKTKADRLRYKVEDDVVRVFITPYKTTISEKDLAFSQGDFNVQLIIAFGVEKHDDLDTAITAHGRILHDATVVTVNLQGASSLGEVDWNDAGASSLCEMLMSLSEALQSGLLDEQIATALLTGLVSATDRFRNEKTTPKVMTMAAQLMAAGANQQLIAEKLEEAATVVVQDLQEATASVIAKSDVGEMKVDHGEGQVTPIVFEEPPQGAFEMKAEEVVPEDSIDAVAEWQEVAVAPEPEQELPLVETAVQASAPPAKSASWREAVTPSIGGTLNATSEQAHEDALEAESEDKNRVLLSHDSPVARRLEDTNTTPALNATGLAEPEPQVEDIFDVTPPSIPAQDVSPIAPQLFPITPTTPDNSVVSSPSGIEFEETPLFAPTVDTQNQILADLEKEMYRQEEQAPPASSVDTARAAVDAAFGSLPFNPAGQPLEATGAMTLGKLEHEDAPFIPPSPVLPAATIQTASQGMLTLPPLPDFSTLPPPPGSMPMAQPLPAEQPTVMPMSAPMFGLPEQPAGDPLGIPVVQPSSDPGQFRLPGA